MHAAQEERTACVELLSYNALVDPPIRTQESLESLRAMHAALLEERQALQAQLDNYKPRMILDAGVCMRACGGGGGGVAKTSNERWRDVALTVLVVESDDRRPACQEGGDGFAAFCAMRLWSLRTLIEERTCAVVHARMVHVIHRHTRKQAAVLVGLDAGRQGRSGWQQAHPHGAAAHPLRAAQRQGCVSA